MIDIKCLDSSAWLAYFFQENEFIKKIIENEGALVTSSLSLFEIKKRLLSLKKDPETALKFMKERSNIIVPGTIITEKAADISISKKLAAIDALIYTTSLVSDSELITGDNDFKGLEKVKIIT